MTHAIVILQRRLTLPVRSMLLPMVTAVRVEAAPREPASETGVGALLSIENITQHTRGLCIQNVLDFKTKRGTSLFHRNTSVQHG